jgi:isopentenyldiphosphate isomerase
MEMLDIVDENGIPTGRIIEREDAHRHGIRHRTSHVWLLRIHYGKVQVLLQKRSLNKDSFPGCYDISSAGHIPAGNGFLESALRELKEELGVAVNADELIYCGQRQFEFREKFHGLEFWDRQISNVYTLWLDKEASEFAIQRSEVAAVMWMDWDMCSDMVKNRKALNCIWIEELEMISSAIKNS